jgi:hypothetical protein
MKPHTITVDAVRKLFAERHPEINLCNSSVKQIMRDRLGYRFRQYNPAVERYNHPQFDSKRKWVARLLA